MLAEEEKDIKQFYEAQEKVIEKLKDMIQFKNCNGYVYIDVKDEYKKK